SSGTCPCRAPERSVLWHRWRGAGRLGSSCRLRVRQRYLGALWYVCRVRVLGELQRLDVGRDGPAVLRRHARGVREHAPEAVGDGVVEVADRGREEPRLVDERRRLREAATYDRAPAVTVVVVTGRA